MLLALSAYRVLVCGVSAMFTRWHVVSTLCVYTLGLRCGHPKGGGLRSIGQGWGERGQQGVVMQVVVGPAMGAIVPRSRPLPSLYHKGL